MLTSVRSSTRSNVQSYCIHANFMQKWLWSFGAIAKITSSSSLSACVIGSGSTAIVSIYYYRPYVYEYIHMIWIVWLPTIGVF